MAFSGQVKILEETTTNMLLAFGLASIFMYMVLAAQFESLAHPFVILLTLPLSIPFALLSLIATGRSLNLFSALGVLLLLGIVKKNGILQIDYMNRLRSEGYSVHDAVIEANRVRLRPILMTTLSIVAGLIPTAVGIGAGASQRSAIAVTIIGGQMLCLLLTLLVVPVGYSYVEQFQEWLRRHRRPVPRSGQRSRDGRLSFSHAALRVSLSGQWIAGIQANLAPVTFFARAVLPGRAAQIVCSKVIQFVASFGPPLASISIGGDRNAHRHHGKESGRRPKRRKAPSTARSAPIPSMP